VAAAEWQSTGTSVGAITRTPCCHRSGRRQNALARILFLPDDHQAMPL
jgi:hypothetical protein